MKQPRNRSLLSIIDTLIAQSNPTKKKDEERVKDCDLPCTNHINTTANAASLLAQMMSNSSSSIDCDGCMISSSKRVDLSAGRRSCVAATAVLLCRLCVASQTPTLRWVNGSMGHLCVCVLCFVCLFVYLGDLAASSSRRLSRRLLFFVSPFVGKKGEHGDVRHNNIEERIVRFMYL